MNYPVDSVIHPGPSIVDSDSRTAKGKENWFEKSGVSKSEINDLRFEFREVPEIGILLQD